MMTLIISLFLHFSFATEIPFTIYHTNDLHSHFDGVKYPNPVEGKNVSIIKGGFSRIATVVQELKKEKARQNEIIFGVDAGDFFAGTIFSAIGPSSQIEDFPEFEFLNSINIDLITLGNHEFDPGNSGLETMLSKIKKINPQASLVATNLFIKNPQSTLNAFVGDEALIKSHVVKTYKSGETQLKVGFLGILGPDGCLVSRSTREDVKFIGFDDEGSRVRWKELLLLLRKKVHMLKKEQGVDIVILSMHGGGMESDHIAKEVAGINVIIAGHTHQEEFRTINNVIISQTGSYGESLGLLNLKFDTVLKRVLLQNESEKRLISIDQNIPRDSNWEKRIGDYRRFAYELMGHGADQALKPVFKPIKDYIRARELFNPMGELVTRALRDQINLGLSDKKIDAYFTSMGLVRTSFLKGVDYNESDIFEAVSIGFDELKRPGTDIVSFYLSTEEFVRLINFLELYSHFSNSFAPAISPNIDYKVRWWGIPFLNRIHNITVNGTDISDRKGLIHVATNRFVYQNISTVESLSYGL
ncbi:MAG: hypothetical protein COV37_06075, partial [Bdellovibrio sp. CG11_big_fil_rev_8_21_14_0_20_39_38]